MTPLELPKDAPESLKEYLKASPRLSLDDRCRPSKVEASFFNKRINCASTRTDNTLDKNFFKADSSALINPMTKRNWAVDTRF